MFDWLSTIFEIGLVIGVIIIFVWLKNLLPNMGNATRGVVRAADIAATYVNRQAGLCGFGGNPENVACKTANDCITSGLCGATCSCDPTQNTCYQSCKTAATCDKGAGITCDAVGTSKTAKRCSGPEGGIPGLFNRGCWVGYSLLGYFALKLGWFIWSKIGFKKAFSKLIDGVKYGASALPGVDGGSSYRGYRDMVDPLDELMEAEGGSNVYQTMSDLYPDAINVFNRKLKTKNDVRKKAYDEWKEKGEGEEPPKPFSDAEMENMRNGYVKLWAPKVMQVKFDLITKPTQALKSTFGDTMNWMKETFKQDRANQLEEADDREREQETQDAADEIYSESGVPVE
jgi:hypothetical protein